MSKLMHTAYVHVIMGALFFIWLEGCTTKETHKKEQIKRPNVLLIVIDTLRADYLSAYGAPKEIAPFLDGWSRESVVLTRHYSTSSWTRPGFATLLTGLYPSEAGIYEELFDRLPDDIETLPETLQKHGYHTFAFNSNPNIDPYFGFDQGFVDFGEAGARFTWMGGKNKEEKEKVGAPFIAADQMSDDALAYMNDLSASSWFGMLVYIDPHKPYHPPNEDIQAVQGIPEEYHPEYAAEVHHAERQIGRLLSTLKESGALENTLVVITSDHGEGLWSHPGVPDSFEHGTYLYDSTNHVPLLLWHPSLTPRILKNVTSSISIAGSILDWTLEQKQERADRPSLRMLMEEGTQPDIPSFAFSQTHWQKMNKRAVRSASGRYIFSQDAEDFQQKQRFEGRPPLRVEAILEGPVRELYRTVSCRESMWLCWEDYREDWQHNQIQNGDSEGLQAILEEWEQRIISRKPQQHDPEDGYSTFVRKEGGISIVDFVSTESADIITPIPETMKEQLQKLGYFE